MDRFAGEFEMSKAKVHPILIYKLCSDPNKCYRFTWLRKNTYFCQGCRNAKKSGQNFRINRILVEHNVFLTDPEKLEHHCLPFTFGESAVVQIYRECMEYGRNNNLNESGVNALICFKIREHFPENWEKMLVYSPRMKKIKDAMVYWKKNHEMHTTNIPERISTLSNNYHEIDSNMIRYYKCSDGNQIFLIMSPISFEIFYHAPAIFVNRLRSCDPAKFEQMHTLHAKFLNLPDKPSFLCGVVIATDRSELFFDTVLNGLSEGLKEYCGNCDSYKQFIFGYDPDFAKVISRVFPNFDFNTSVYYNSEIGLQNIVNNRRLDSGKSLPEIKAALWLDRLSYCVNPEENFNRMFRQLLKKADKSSVYENLFANRGIIMPDYLSRWNKQNDPDLKKQIPNLDGDLRDYYLMDLANHPNNFLLTYYTKDYGEYFQFRFYHIESAELFKVFDFFKWELATNGNEYVNYVMPRIKSTTNDKYIKTMTFMYEKFKNTVKMLFTNYNSLLTDPLSLKELVSFVEKWRFDHLYLRD